MTRFKTSTYAVVAENADGTFTVSWSARGTHGVRIKLQGTVDFRDAGGYRTADGHWVEMGEIYRSDALNLLTADDLAKLKRLGVRTVFDLRRHRRP
ncbi:tyrosine-protein phosphatase [Streptomyces sp. NPDC048370]|uniref:tyrosine-protein phosphatase n=1 Tax=Streptomyces sp. NPDC048370 TaxID=3365540 RepID=UPI0037180BD9